MDTSKPEKVTLETRLIKIILFIVVLTQLVIAVSLLMSGHRIDSIATELQQLTQELK